MTLSKYMPFRGKKFYQKKHINQYFLKIVTTLTRKCDSDPLDEKPVDLEAKVTLNEVKIISVS